jgi:hypothetical protein
MSTEDIQDTAFEINEWNPALSLMEQAKALHADKGFMIHVSIETLDGGAAILTPAMARDCECEIDPPETLLFSVALNFGQEFDAAGKEIFDSRPMGGRDEALAILRAFPRRVFLVDEHLPQAKGRLVELAEQAAEVTICSM